MKIIGSLTIAAADGSVVMEHPDQVIILSVDPTLGIIQVVNDIRLAKENLSEITVFSGSVRTEYHLIHHAVDHGVIRRGKSHGYRISGTVLIRRCKHIINIHTSRYGIGI